jgi:hypothetical protein
MPPSRAKLRTYSFKHIFYCITSDLSWLIEGVVCNELNFKLLNLLHQTLKQSAVRKIRSKHLWKMNTYSCEAALLFKAEFLLMASLSYGGHVQLFLQHWEKTGALVTHNVKVLSVRQKISCPKSNQCDLINYWYWH